MSPPSFNLSNADFIAPFRCAAWYVSAAGFRNVIGMNLSPSSALGGEFVNAIAADGSASFAACGFAPPGSSPAQQLSKYRPSHPARETLSGCALAQMSVERKCDRL